MLTDSVSLPSVRESLTARPLSLDSVETAIKRVHVAFEFMEKLGVPYYCFHDRDVAPEGKTLKDSNVNLDKIAAVLQEENGGEKK